VTTALLVAGSTWKTSFASTSSYSSVVQSTRLLVKCGQLTCGLFQLTHRSHDDPAVQLIKFNGGQHEGKTLLQCSQHCHKSEFRHVNISAWQRSLWCGQNHHGPFLRATLSEHLLEQWQTWRQKGT